MRFELCGTTLAPRSLSLALFVTLALSAVGMTACQESQQAVCGDDSDCPDDQVCTSGVCELPSSPCTNSQDCAPDQICIDDQCRDPSGLDATLPDIPSQPDTNDGPEDTGKQDAPPVDTEPPEFLSIDPADDASDVAVDASITVTFNEEIRDTSVTGANFSLLGPANESVSTSITQTSNTEIVLEPDAAMHPASPYTVVINEDIRDTAGLPLGETMEFTFHTAASPLMRHRTIARKWAPVVYQGIHEPDDDGPRTDIPTRVDFDGDMQASNNATNARTGTGLPGAHVYYHVTESRSHTFIQYVLYYTTYSEDGGATHTEHHFAGATFTIERGTGTLLSVDGVDLNDSGLNWISFSPSDANLGTKGSTLSRASLDASTWSLIDGNHYPMYVKAGTHETCHWRAESVGSAPVKCAHNSESFIASTGVKMTAGSTAETFADAEPPQGSPDGIQEMTYRLIPIESELWPFRRPFGSDRLYASGFTYTPSPDNGSRPIGFDETAHTLPGSLASDDTESIGRTPFRWRSFSSAGIEGRGQWLLDPAHIAGERYDFSSRGVSLSTEYCYNLFFDIDLRQSAGCPPLPSSTDAGTDAGTGADGS
jgi:hypothetical protein